MVAAGGLGADRPRRAPDTGSIPALYLSMTAVDRSWRGKGLGSDLAIDALGRALNVAGEVGLKLVVPDVIDDGGNDAFARDGKGRRGGIPAVAPRADTVA